MSDDRTFFVVYRFHGGEHYAVEYGDFRNHHDKWRTLNREVIYRADVTGTTMTLDQLIDAYKAGWRAKEKEKPKVEAPKTFNSVKRPGLT